MALLTRLFAPRPSKNQQEIAGRAAEVIDHVLFDVGIDTFVNGTLLLDNQFHVRFFGGRPPRGPDVIASVAVDQLDEAREFRTRVHEALLDNSTLNLHTNSVVSGLMRELKAQSEALRALPPEREGYRNTERSAPDSK
jgi:hypothetical protein